MIDTQDNQKTESESDYTQKEAKSGGQQVIYMGVGVRISVGRIGLADLHTDPFFRGEEGRQYSEGKPASPLGVLNWFR